MSTGGSTGILDRFSQTFQTLGAPWSISYNTRGHDIRHGSVDLVCGLLHSRRHEVVHITMFSPQQIDIYSSSSNASSNCYKATDSVSSRPASEHSREHMKLVSDRPDCPVVDIRGAKFSTSKSSCPSSLF